ncbi:MAG: acetyl-CoA carboxylase biotin carboxylase subunit [Elusimicrobia bacterium]|nr:acetyl-CoA carboxylase biotin carboxylase subunit [Elusimicrobiota bacterium]
MPSFTKVLIANRSEIAVRVIRACRHLGLKTVAVYSEADREAMHVSLADEAVCIGPGPARDSYLKFDAVLAAAKITGAEAIHPGYGFLSENSDFAAACAERGFTFIGPAAESIRKLGYKSTAKALAIETSVPVVPGTKGLVDGDFLKVADEIGFPVMVKAASGGGGKGLRFVRSREDLKRELEMAQSEAKAAFGDGSVYIEKFIEKPRHVEIQIMADSHGTVVAFPERDCSTQRRHQKLIEESPSPAVTPQIRSRMQEAAVRLAKAARYVNAGTVEFLLDKKGNFYFIEVNTRLQVEHPVTETVTGLDLCAEQLRVAMGERLSFDQARAAEPMNACIEFRVNAEDPARGFAPCPGRVDGLRLPGGPGVRIDTHLYAGYTVPSYYDSLLAKLIVSGTDRPAAIARSIQALREFSIEGPSTTIPFHLKVLAHPRFRSGDIDTGFTDEMMAAERAQKEDVTA